MELKCSFLLNCRHHRCNVLTSPTAVAIWIWDVAGCKQSGSAMMLMPGSAPQINLHLDCVLRSWHYKRIQKARSISSLDRNFCSMGRLPQVCMSFGVNHICMTMSYYMIGSSLNAAFSFFLLWFGLHSWTIEVEPCQWTSNKSQKMSGFWCTTSNYRDDRPPQDWQSWSIARLGFSCCQAVGCRLKQSKSWWLWLWV